MTDREALLASVRDNPDDDLPRLVYADWLDEHATSKADVARAAFIRIQVELARMNGGVECAKVHNPLVGYATFNPRCRCEPCSLKRREYMVSRSFIAWEWHQQVVPPWMIGSNDWARGFPESCSGRWREWLEHSGSLLRYPIRRVRLTVRPTRGAGSLTARWFAVGSANGLIQFNRMTCSMCEGTGLNRLRTPSTNADWNQHCSRCDGSPQNEWTCNRWPDLVFEMPETDDVNIGFSESPANTRSRSPGADHLTSPATTS